jgi:hypothetical protein
MYFTIGYIECTCAQMVATRAIGSSVCRYCSVVRGFFPIVSSLERRYVSRLHIRILPRDCLDVLRCTVRDGHD